uniref:GST N-terminal domain-containing protein n=1 Tax=Ascaris lumbricoides TaxID=6252 RepID=A0A0M3HU27_ASCLU
MQTIAVFLITGFRVSVTGVCNRSQSAKDGSGAYGGMGMNPAPFAVETASVKLKHYQDARIVERCVIAWGTFACTTRLSCALAICEKGQSREFPELSPKFQKLNPPELADYTGVQPNGYVDPNSGEFVVVKEACAELVVPDLTDFKLRPYVSFKTDVRIEERRRAYEEIVKQKGSEELADLYVLEDQRWPPPRITARTLFDLYYAQEIR